MIGAKISQYTVLEKIGEGGMGAVWKARDEKLGRTVALKFLSKADSPDSKSRFTQEARAASSLSHPGIVTIFDIFEHGDRACIVMEFVEGRTLSQVIPAGGLAMREAVRLGIQIADALSAAHKAGVIHRDIKPGNIIVTPDGRAKLLDFGLAKLAEIAAAPDDATQTVGDVRTSEGSILGTVNYMSPEQAQGKPVDPRTDIFSLGAVLYEMATGGKAFQGDTTVSTITAILRDEPKPIAPDPAGLSTELGRLVMQCLRKEPDRRVQTALDVRNALEQLHENIRSAGSTIHAALPTKSSRPWAAIAVGLVALGGLGAWFLTTRSNVAGPQTESIVIRPFAPQLVGAKSNANFSPDGKSIAVAWDGGTLEAQNLYIVPLDGAKPTRLTRGPEEENNPFYSPDGSRVFFTRVLQAGPHTFSVPATGGEGTRIAEGSAMAVSDDGLWIIVSRRAGMGSTPAASGTFVVQLSNGQQRQLLPPSAEYFDGTFSISPDGRWVYFSRGVDRGSNSTAMRVPFAGGEPEPVALPSVGREGLRVESVRFFGRGRGMVVRVLDESAKARRTYLLKVDGTDPVLLPASVPAGAVSPDGRRLIASSGYSIRPLYRAPAFPNRQQKVTFEKVLDSPRAVDAVRFAPDADHVVVSDSRSGRQILYRWDAAFRESRVLFDKSSGVTGSPTYSPDSQWVAFDSRVGSPSPDIWVVPAAGGEAHRLTDGPAEDNTPCFDTTGDWVYFTSDREGDQQLFKVARTGGPQSRVTKGGGFSCQASPDGKYLYYLQSRERGQIWRIDLSTGTEEPVLPAYKNRNWKVLSDGLYLMDTATNSQILQYRPGTAFFYRFATRKIEPIGFTTPRPINYTGIEVSPDRKWVYFPMTDAQATDLQLVENLPFPGGR